jgi:hypothetical protein
MTPSTSSPKLFSEPSFSTPPPVTYSLAIRKPKKSGPLLWDMPGNYRPDLSLFKAAHWPEVINASGEDLFWRWCGSQPYAFARTICCRARKTVRSPASRSPHKVHSREATLRGSMRSADQKVSSPTRCCFA